MEKRIFIILCSVIIVVFGGWYIFVYQPQQVAAQRVIVEIDDILKKLRDARHARLDINNLENSFDEEQKNLEKIKARFINKNELSKVTRNIKTLANKHNLNLTDFAPALDNYFSDTDEDTVIALPLAITVTGNYLDIGRFIEKWDQLNYYLIAEEISIEKMENKKYGLMAKINAKLYTWNN